MTSQTEQAIAADLNLCDLGEMFTRGKVRARYVAHRRACFQAIREMNAADGLSEVSDDELLAALAA